MSDMIGSRRTGRQNGRCSARCPVYYEHAAPSGQKAESYGDLSGFDAAASADGRGAGNFWCFRFFGVHRCLSVAGRQHGRVGIFLYPLVAYVVGGIALGAVVVLARCSFWQVFCWPHWNQGKTRL